MFERDKDELREIGIPLADAVIDARLRRRGGLPHRQARVRPARDRVRARRGGRARCWPPAPGPRASLAASAAGAAQAAPAGRRDRRLVVVGDRAASSGPPSRPSSPCTPRVSAVRRSPSTTARRTGEAHDASAPALGAGAMARPLVRHRHDLVREARESSGSAVSRAAVVRQGRPGAYQPPGRPRRPDDGQSRPAASAPTRTATYASLTGPETPCAGARSGRPSVDGDGPRSRCPTAAARRRDVVALGTHAVAVSRPELVVGLEAALTVLRGRGGAGRAGAARGASRARQVQMADRA